MWPPLLPPSLHLPRPATHLPATVVSARPRSSVPAAAFYSFSTWAAVTCAATARLVSPVNSRPPGVLSCYEAANKAPPFYLVVVQVAEPATKVVQLHAVASAHYRACASRFCGGPPSLFAATFMLPEGSAAASVGAARPAVRSPDPYVSSG